MRLWRGEVTEGMVYMRDAPSARVRLMIYSGQGREPYV
jgi:hypothetical protein